MNPATHLLISWGAATIPDLSERERLAIVLAGVIPDVDAAGWLVRLATAGEGIAGWAIQWHHVLGHNIFFGAGFSMAGALLAARGIRRRAVVWGLSLLTFHLHLLCDVLGSRGPDGYGWPIAYLWPLNPDFEISWSGQWALNAWPNVAITVAALAWLFIVAVRRGISPVEWFSGRWNALFVETVRRRVGRGGREAP